MKWAKVIVTRCLAQACSHGEDGNERRSRAVAHSGPAFPQSPVMKVDCVLQLPLDSVRLGRMVCKLGLEQNGKG